MLCSVELVSSRHIGSECVCSVLHALLSHYQWKTNDRMSTVGHVNRPLTEQSLLTFTTCHCIRHIVLFSVSTSIGLAFFFLLLVAFAFFSISSSHDCVRYIICVLQYTHPSQHTHTFIELSCESWYSPASSVAHVSLPILFFLHSMLRLRQCWQTRTSWSIHLTIIYHPYRHFSPRILIPSSTNYKVEKMFLLLFRWSLSRTIRLTFLLLRFRFNQRSASIPRCPIPKGICRSRSATNHPRQSLHANSSL